MMLDDHRTRGHREATGEQRNRQKLRNQRSILTTIQNSACPSSRAATLTSTLPSRSVFSI